MNHCQPLAADSAISRRRLIGVAGATALGWSATSTDVAAAADGTASAGDSGTGSPIEGASPTPTDAIPPATSGLSYVPYSQFDFHSNSAVTRTITDTGVYALGSYIACGLQLPAGTHVRELTVWATNASGSAKVLLLTSSSLDGVAPSPTTETSVTIPNAATIATPTTVATDFLISAGRTYDLEALTGDTTFRIRGCRLGFDSVPVFVPIAPYRAYDSRLAGVPASGPLTRLASRQVTVVNAIDLTGVIAVPQIIPVTARAITYNLTATGTSAGNYLSIAPGNAASTTVSSVNWSGAGQSIANGGTVGIDAGKVKVFCGDQAGSAHFIIDVTGYYM